MIPQHSSSTQEHYTPRTIVEAARKVLGVIDLDPASCEEAQERVKAERFIGLPKDGLAELWTARTVFLNPPGGTFTARRKRATDAPVQTSAEDAAHKARWKTDSRAVAWWRALALAHDELRVRESIFVGFTLEILRTAQREGPSPASRGPAIYPFCIPRDRLHFGGDQPTHGNVIIYRGDAVYRFREVFSEFGATRGYDIALRDYNLPQSPLP